MRYLLVVKSNGEQFVYNSEVDALGFFKKKFGGDLNWCLFRSLVTFCVTDFTFENDKFILKGEIDD